jgi:pyruvyltransferase
LQRAVPLLLENRNSMTSSKWLARLNHWIRSRNEIAVFSWSRTGVQNFGDELNLLLVPALSGKRIFRVEQNCPWPHVAAIGSVLHLVGPGATVWGSGAISSEHALAVPARICAVRGPLTRARLVKAGIDCPEIYGDPGLLAPLIYQPRTAGPRRVLGIVPHYRDYERVLARFPRAFVIDVRDTPETVMDAIAGCEHIVSSSLHGVIIADVFGIRSRWARFSDDLIGGGFKFLDYYSSIGRVGVEALNLAEQAPSEDELIRCVRDNWRQPELDVAPLLRAAPFRLTPEIARLAARPLPVAALRAR